MIPVPAPGPLLPDRRRPAAGCGSRSRGRRPGRPARRRRPPRHARACARWSAPPARSGTRCGRGCRAARRRERRQVTRIPASRDSSISLEGRPTSGCGGSRRIPGCFPQHADHRAQVLERLVRGGRGSLPPPARPPPATHPAGTPGHRRAATAARSGGPARRASRARSGPVRRRGPARPAAAARSRPARRGRAATARADAGSGRTCPSVSTTPMTSHESTSATRYGLLLLE